MSIPAVHRQGIQGQQTGMDLTPLINSNNPPPPPGYPPHDALGYAPPPGYNPQQGYDNKQGSVPCPPGPVQYPPGPGQYPPYGGPIINQPVGPGGIPASGWMNMPEAIPNCPPGLEYLTMIDQLIVDQQIELLEVVSGCETNNKFIVKNTLGQKVYFAAEDNDCCTLNCCGPLRPFDMKILDNYGNEVIHLYRPLACGACCFPCCLQSIEVSAPPGTILGTVEQKWSLCYPTFAVKNVAGDTLLRIDGPLCTMSCGNDVEFKVMSSDGSQQLGKISKQWSGFVREMFTDADVFGITFPMELDVKTKAVLLGACFLIDAMFFESSGGGHASAL